MGLFGALFTGVSALSAQSQNTAIISNNIANVQTTGFKRSEAAFQSLVTTANNTSRFSPGTVTAGRIQRVSEQGTLSQSASSTDAAVSGNGFFSVKRDGDDSALTEFLYTRNGQFSEDSQGFLRNSAGFFLYGWPLDTQGNLPANQGDLDSLVPIDVAFLGGLTRPTGNAEISVNVDAREVDTLLANAPATGADFIRGLTVFDSLGTPQNLSFEFVKTYGPQATITSTLNNFDPTENLLTQFGLSDGDTFTVDDGGGAVTFEVDDDATVGVGNVAITTVNDILNGINDNVPNASAFLGNDGQIVIQHDQFVLGTETITVADTSGSPLADIGIAPGAATSDNLNASTDFSNGASTDTPPYSGGDFPALQFQPGSPNYNARGWWQLSIKDPNTNILSSGLINFARDGTVNALPDTDGKIDVELSAIDWGNGSTIQPIEVDISRFSQFASDYSVLFTDQDGAELGLRTGISIDRDGQVIAQFSNGASSVLYKLPLVTFANQNGLSEESGTAYTETDDSGEENLREAGTGGAGFVEPSTLENSNVDLADEFAKLIVAQRAYSAGTKIINTVDQMTQELLQLR